MLDIEKAKSRLIEDSGLTCVFCKGEVIYTSKLKGIRPIMLKLLEGIDVKGFSVADKIVGKAAAMLFAFAGIKEIYTYTITKSALEFLEKSDIKFSFEAQIETIEGCKMEATVKNIENPAQAFEDLKEKLIELRGNK